MNKRWLNSIIDITVFSSILYFLEIATDGTRLIAFVFGWIIGAFLSSFFNLLVNKEKKDD